jgi:hypothetical protein
MYCPCTHAFPSVITNYRLPIWVRNPALLNFAPNEGPVPSRVEKNYGGNHGRPENKGLGAATEPSLLCTSFMKFRGPEALKDRWDEKAGLGLEMQLSGDLGVTATCTQPGGALHREGHGKERRGSGQGRKRRREDCGRHGTKVGEGGKTVTVKAADGTEDTFEVIGHGTKEGAVDTAKGAEKGGKVTVYYTEKAGKKVAHFFEKL